MSPQVWVAVVALVIAIVSACVSIKSYRLASRTSREAYRPIVTARVQSFGEPGNVATALDIVIRNSGNRPALDVALRVEEADIDAALSPKADAVLLDRVKSCFSPEAIIPVLEGGSEVKNSFGVLGSNKPTWIANAIINVNVRYHDMTGRTYEENIKLKISPAKGFAGGYWAKA